MEFLLGSLTIIIAAIYKLLTAIPTWAVAMAYMFRMLQKKIDKRTDEAEDRRSLMQENLENQMEMQFIVLKKKIDEIRDAIVPRRLVDGMDTSLDKVFDGSWE